MVSTLSESHTFRENFTHLLHSLWRVIQIWSDFIVVILLIGLYLAYVEYHHQGRMQLIDDPKINDFYFVDYHLIEPSSGITFRYMPLKITSIDGELVTFRIGNIGHSTQVAITQHVKFDMPDPKTSISMGGSSCV